MLVAADLRDALLTATLDQTVTETVLQSMATCIQTYIMDNAVVNFTWNGITPLLVAEDTTPTGKILDLVFNFTPSFATAQEGFFSHFKTELVAGLTACKYNITESNYSITPGLMSTSPMLNNLTLSISGSDRDAALLQMATCIVDWVKLQLPTQILTGNHLVYAAPPGDGGLVTSII